MLGRFKHTIYKFRHVRSENGCPSSVVCAILGIDFLVVEMFWPHMTVFRNIAGEIAVGSLMFAQQTVVAVAYLYLRVGCLKDCRLSTLRVNYGIVVVIVLYVVVIRDLADCFVITNREDSARQWFQTWFVIAFKCVKS